MAYLYETFNNSIVRQILNQVKIPEYVKDNLKFPLRHYQEEAFRRYIYLDSEDFDEKPNKPLHILYNMATGSGKTLIMAGLILYLYEQGYRNFLFFVNSNNIIEKTKDNFLNPLAQKYLFNNKIVINGKEVFIKEVENFDESDNENINIKFVSIQMLTSGLLLNVRENGLSFEDFKERKLVLIGDEAHHNNAEVWGDLVEKIHKMNFENILLEFTATLDYESREITEKYQDKVIFKYDLAEFRVDKYSKEINLIRSFYDEEERIMQALILNLYRQELATEQNINLKPVILFKAKRRIKESEQNKERFHKLIENLSSDKITKIQQTSTVPIVQKAFSFFDKKNINYEEIVKRIKANFKEENCLSANNDKEAETNQIRLNTLENENNPIRAIFAVKKLNEGWDVLNLFDIVRLYEGRDGRAGKPGKTTISEAQLVGRGARYYPFRLEEGQDPYTRKFDDDNSNDLKILEELYFHTKDDKDGKYISELKRALVDTGVYVDEDDLETKQLQLKLDFKKSDFYKKGKVVYNKWVEKDYGNVKSFDDLGVKNKNHKHQLSSGFGKVSSAFFELEQEHEAGIQKQKDIKLSKRKKHIKHIIRFAISQYPFFHFSNIVKYFPNIGSLSNFIESKDYIGGLEITFKGTQKRLNNLTNLDYLFAIQGLLESIESEIKSNLTEYEGSDYINDYVHNVFKDNKEIKVYKDSERSDGQEELVANEPWYVYNANYGTSEEKQFVEMFARRLEHLEKKFENIYLIRNEREVKIIDKIGRAFEPDFILFCKQKKGEELTYQVFIEPKGKHLKSHDKWKEEFLEEIRAESRTIKIDTDKYLITAVPLFYNNEDENEFKEKFEKTLNE
jgi:type III restriction enzyme